MWSSRYIFCCFYREQNRLWCARTCLLDIFCSYPTFSSILGLYIMFYKSYRLVNQKWEIYCIQRTRICVPDAVVKLITVLLCLWCHKWLKMEAKFVGLPFILTFQLAYEKKVSGDIWGARIISHELLCSYWICFKPYVSLNESHACTRNTKFIRWRAWM